MPKAPSSAVKSASADAPKPSPSGSHKAAKSARWLFRRRPRVSTAERNAAQQQEARNAATSSVTTRATASERAEDRRLAR
jgi:hypothetical protein